MVEKEKAKVRSKTAWRIEGTLREFPKFEPVNLWFDYPVHRLDEIGSLKDLQLEAQDPPWKREPRAIKRTQQREKQTGKSPGNGIGGKQLWRRTDSK